MFGKSVTLEGGKIDRYGRRVAKLIVNGRGANLEMLIAGLTWWYREYQQGQTARDREIYSAAEAAAGSKKLNLWSIANPLPPWEFRHGSPSANVTAVTNGAIVGNRNSKIYHSPGARTTTRSASEIGYCPNRERKRNLRGTGPRGTVGDVVEFIFIIPLRGDRKSNRIPPNVKIEPRDVRALSFTDRVGDLARWDSVFAHRILPRVSLAATRFLRFGERPLRPKRSRLLDDHPPPSHPGPTHDSRSELEVQTAPQFDPDQLLVHFVLLVVSSLFFIPELIAFSESPNAGLSASEWLNRGNRWQRLSWVRGTVMYLGILPLLFAVAKPHGDRTDINDCGLVEPRAEAEPAGYRAGRNCK